MSNIQSSGKNNIARYCISLVHFLLTFVFERYSMDFSGRYCSNTVVINQILSTKMEMVISYVISKIIAAVIIALFWKLVFSIVNGNVPKQIVLIFGILFFIGAIAVIVMLPDSFQLEIDNNITFYYSRHFTPYYLHSVFTSSFYAACLMVAPHPATIAAVQWLAFVCTNAYIYNELDSISTKFNNIKWLSLAFLLAPEAYYVIINPYRNCLYAILCLFYFALIIFASVKKNAKKPPMVSLLILSAFISVWRTEGIVFGVFGFLYALIFIYQYKLKQIVLYEIVVLACIGVLKIPQSVGEKKYFGSDYLMQNMVPAMQNILNSEDANVTYNGFSEDIKAIDDVCPVDWIKQSGMWGYWANNVQNSGNNQQSLAGKEKSSSFVRAGLRLILHNPQMYIKTQLNDLYYAIGLDYSYKMPSYIGTRVDFPEWTVSEWTVGQDEYLSFYSNSWINSNIRIKTSEAIQKIWLTYIGAWHKFYAFVGIHVVSILFLFFVIFREIAKIAKKEYDGIKFALLSGLFLAELILIILTMPEGRRAYLYPFLYCAYLMEIVYIGFLIQGKKRKQDEA